MSKINCLFKASISDKTGITATTVNNLYILEREGEYPRAVLRLDRREYNRLNSLEFCDIIRDDVLFLRSRVCGITLLNKTMEIELTTDIKGNCCPEKIRNEFSDILEKFKGENPELFTKISTEEFLRTGETVRSEIKSPKSPPIEIDNSVIEGSISSKELLDIPLSEINLSLKAAWISKRDGMVPISTKIEKRFKMARINTLTPKKLENSWPEFGERIRSNGTALTKYMIASSRLRETSTQSFPAIVIDNSIPKLRFKKHIYDNRLLIAWDFEQYMTEVINIRILAGRNIPQKTSKNLNINLGNVQEYIENPSTISFFRSKNGNLILNAIVKSIGDFMAFSWRNVEVSCELIENDKTTNLSCRDWIRLRNKNYKITQIEREISFCKSLIKIKARAFSLDFPSGQYLPEIILSEEKTKILTPEDIVKDIAVSNEADIQYEKLLKFISQLKAENKINKNNYKSLINKFLNETQTKIQIVARPLKTKHCEKKIIEPLEICFENGDEK